MRGRTISPLAERRVPGERAGQDEWLCFLLSIGHESHLFLFLHVYASLRGNPIAFPHKRVYNFKWT